MWCNCCRFILMCWHYLNIFSHVFFYIFRKIICSNPHISGLRRQSFLTQRKVINFISIVFNKKNNNIYEILTCKMSSFCANSTRWADSAIHRYLARYQLTLSWGTKARISWHHKYANAHVCTFAVFSDWTLFKKKIECLFLYIFGGL